MNFAECGVVYGEAGMFCVVIVTSAAPDGRPGCYWSLHYQGGGQHNSGYSGGVDGSGLASFHTAMKNGKAAARRWLKRHAQALRKEGCL